MKVTRRAVHLAQFSTVAVAIAAAILSVLILSRLAGGHEPPVHQPHAASPIPAGSIPAIGYRPEVVGYYRPVLLRAPSLFPNVFIRYRRSFVFEPLHPSPAMPTPPPVHHFRFE